MRKWIGMGIVILLMGLIAGQRILTNPPQETDLGAAAAAIPLSFIPNQGQVSAEAAFYAMAPEYVVWLKSNGIIIDRFHDVSTIEFLGADPEVSLEGLDPSPAAVNFFLGDDPSTWRQNLPVYGAVLYRNVYPGIDLKVYQGEHGLEYDWHVRPGAETSDIRIQLQDVSGSHISREGDLEVTTSAGLIRHARPYSYQVINGREIAVDSSFIEYEDGAFGFNTAEYDPQHPLVIDPYLLVYSTFLGGSKEDGCLKIHVDKEGAAYVLSAAKSPDFPVKNAFMKKRQGAWDMVITKIAPDGGRIIYSTYYGGSSDDYGCGLTVDDSGAAYISGYTKSKDLPQKNAYQGSYKGGREEAFFAKISPEGDRLLLSSYFGGTEQDRAYDIEVDANLDIYLVGATDSSDFPLKKALQGSLGGGYDAFVAKFSDFGEKLAFSTFLGGVLLDSATGSALYKNSHLYLAGYTGSHDFPVKKPIQGVKASSQDAFVTKISSSGDKMVFSTFLGGNGIDRGQGIAVDKKGAAYVTGWTEAWDFPTKKQVFNNRPSTDAFVTKIDKGGNQIVYSTYIGGSYADWGYAIAVDKRKAAVIVGITKSSLFPLKNALQTSLLGDADVFITKIHPKGARMQFSTYLGGSGFDQARTVAVDAKKAIYIAGETYASDFPLKKALRSIFKGVDEGFVLKIK